MAETVTAHDLLVRISGEETDRVADREDRLLAALLATCRPAWHEQALCRGDGCERWTPDRYEGRAKIDACREVCRRCPASEVCLASELTAPGLAAQSGPVVAGLGRRHVVRLRSLVARGLSVEVVTYVMTDALVAGAGDRELASVVAELAELVDGER